MAAPLRIGPIELEVPVVLAPMAGITNAAYRQLCREQAEAGVRGVGERTRPAGLFVCEMITSRGIVERDRKTLGMLRFDPGERVRSVQLYGVDPMIMARATEILIVEHGVDHVDLNFGCPVPKVTRKGGGAALPYKRDRLEAILVATVRSASRYDVPVTIKTRIGIDDDHQTYLDAGRIAERAGCAAIALHGRTARQYYSGAADWTAIARLKEHVSIPVLGNGDIWEAADAKSMIDQTGADGVVVGRGCLGRPWLFADLAATFSRPQPTSSRPEPTGSRPEPVEGPSSSRPEPVEGPVAGNPGLPFDKLQERHIGLRQAQPTNSKARLPDLGEVAAMLHRHAELLAETFGDERSGLTDLRKHMAWYLKGFPVGGDLRRSLAQVSSLAELDSHLSQLPPDVPFPRLELGLPRGRQGSPRDGVALPEGWLADRSGAGLDLASAEIGVSGG